MQHSRTAPEVTLHSCVIACLGVCGMIEFCYLMTLLQRHWLYIAEWRGNFINKPVITGFKAVSQQLTGRSEEHHLC
jgi:hypothetical protein